MPASESPKSAAPRTILVIGLGLFCTSFGQPSVAGGYPIRYFLKDHMHLSPSQVSGFFLVATLFWYLKPLAGLVADSFPIRGSSRRSYLILSAAASAAAWVAMGFVEDNYGVFLLTATLLNAALVVGSTVSGGLLVEEAQAIQATGRLSALRQLLTNLSLLIAAPAGIWAYDHLSFSGAALAIGAIFVPMGLCAAIYLQDPVRHPPGATKALQRVAGELALLRRSRLLWITAGMWALVVLAPGFGTLLVFRQTDVLHFPHAFVGRLALFSSAAGILASALYAWLCRFVPLRALLPLSILATAAGALLYLHYDARNALWVDSANGALSVFSLLPLFDMAARATPRAAASLGYAILMSVNNLVVQAADRLGSMLYDRFHWSFHELVWLNSLTTLAALIAVPFLPRRLLESKDA